MKAEGLIHFFRVQAAVAQQLARKQEDRDFVAVTRPRHRIKIDVDDIDGDALGTIQSGKLTQHFLAQTAPGARVQQETLRVNDEESRRRCRLSPSGR